MEEETLDNFVDKHDGFIICGKDLSFCQNGRRELTISKTLLCKKRKNTMFKGISVFWNKENLVEIELGRFGGFVIHQVFVNNGLCEEWPHEDFKLIREMMIEAISYAVSKLPNDLMKPILKRAKNYREVVTHRRQFKDSRINIPKEHVNRFGYKLNRKLQSLLESSPDFKRGTTTFSVTYSFGQNSALEESLSGDMAFMDLAAATEYVMHFRRDYIPEAGKGAFWKREPVCEKMGKSPEEEYYPGLLSQYGNFYFQNTRRQRDISVCLTKFYTNLCSTVHTEGNRLGRPFCQPYVRDFLANKLTDHELDMLDPDTLSAWSKERVYPLSDVQARLELIISNPRPSRYPITDVIDKFRDEIGEKAYGDLLEFLEMENVKVCVRRVVDVCSNTLEDLILAKSLGDTTEAGYIANIGDLHLAQVCEAILCYAFYGTALHGDGKLMHDLKLLNFLNLKESNFKQGDVFRGIDALSNIDVVDGKLVLITEQVPGIKRIFISLGLPKDLATSFDDSFNEIAVEYELETQSRMLDELAQLFIKVFIANIALKKAYLPSHNYRQGMQKLFQMTVSQLSGRKSSKIVSSVDLAKFIETTRMSPFRHVLPVMLQNLGQMHYDTFLRVIPKAIDTFMYEHQTYLIFPAERNTTLIVLPFNKTNMHRLSDLSVSEKQQWNTLFDQVARLKKWSCYDCDLFRLAIKVQDQNQNDENPVSGDELIIKLVLQNDLYEVDVLTL